MTNYQNLISISVEDTNYFNNLSESVHQQIIDKISIYGIVGIELKAGNRNVARENLKQIAEYLGKIQSHKHSSDGLVDITMKQGYYDQSVKRPQSDNGHQTPHTDGVFGVTPEFMVMYCIEPANLGGETIIIDMRDALLYMMQFFPHLLPSLFIDNAATVIRGDARKSGPVFAINSGIIEGYFSNHEYNLAIVNPECKEAYDTLNDYITSTTNQKTLKSRPGTLWIYSNKRILHGRNAFNDLFGKERHYVRGWYDGSGAWNKSSMKGIPLEVEQFSKLQNLVVR